MKISNLLTLVVFLASATSGYAEEFPSRPITLVVPGTAGSTADVVARKVAEQMTADMGQPVVVDNKVGAGGAIAYDSVARQKPDGYMLGIALGGFSIVNVMYKSVRFDVIKSFTPVTQLVISPMIFVTRPDAPFGTLAELVAIAKERPGKLKYGSFGVGSSSHIAAEMFKRAAQVDIAHIPYKTSAATTPDLLSGQLDFAVIDAVTALSLVSGGMIKALAVSGPTRVPALPQVPTATEAGVLFSSVGWVGLFAPSGLPENVLERVAASANKAMRRPDTLSFLAQSGSQVPDPPLSPAEWSERFRGYVDTSTKVAREANMVAE